MISSSITSCRAALLLEAICKKRDLKMLHRSLEVLNIRDGVIKTLKLPLTSGYSYVFF